MRVNNLVRRMNLATTSLIRPHQIPRHYELAVVVGERYLTRLHAGGDSQSLKFNRRHHIKWLPRQRQRIGRQLAREVSSGFVFRFHIPTTGTVL